MLDDQIQKFEPLWCSFRETYEYSLDLATLAQSIAILAAVGWNDITLDAFIMASHFLHKQHRHSGGTENSPEASLSEAVCDELARECPRFNKCLLTPQLLRGLQEEAAEIFSAARAWQANRHAKRALQKRVASNARKAEMHGKLAAEYRAQAREYILLAGEHERTADWHARKAEAYSKGAEESLPLLRGHDFARE